MEQRIDSDVIVEPDNRNTPCAERNTPINVHFHGYCLNCHEAFTEEEGDDHSCCATRLLSSIAADAKTEHAEWQQFQVAVPTLIQNECRRVDDAAESAIAAVSKIIHGKAEELKNGIHRSCSQKCLSSILTNQAQHEERVAELGKFDKVDSSESEFIKILHQLANHVPYPPPQSCGTFYPAIAEVVSLAKFMFLGRVLGSLGDEQVCDN
jgi:hypothetical protein